MPINLTWVFSLVFVISTNILHAQYWDNSYSHFDKKDGLPSNKIYFVSGDLKGNLWIGTDAGLCEFNGSEFKVYNSEDGLPSDEVYELKCDSKNRIWAVTMGNEIAFIENGRIHNGKSDSSLKKVSIPDRISRVIEDNNNDVWIFSFPFTITKLKKNKVINESFFKGKLNCSKVIRTNEGILVISNENSILYNYKTSKYEMIQSSNKIEINDLLAIDDSTFIYSDVENNIRRINCKVNQLNFKTTSNVLSVFKKDSLIWQLRNDGVCSYNLKDLTKKQTLLKDFSVSNFYSDVYSNIWISTLNNGLFKLNSLDVVNFIPSVNNTSNSISAVFVSDDKIVLGRNNGSVSIVDKRKRENNLSVKLTDKSILSFRILKILQFKNEYILCTDIGIFKLSSLNFKVNQLVKKGAFKNIYLEDNKFVVLDNISVTNASTEFNFYKEFRKFDRFYSHTIYQNKKLFGSENALYYEDDSLKIYKLDQPFHYRLMDMKTKDSLLVIATAEKGVFFIHDHQIIRNLNLQGGLNSNSATKILEYKNQWVFATNNGIAMYDFKTKNLDKIMESDGLASNNVLDIAIDNDTLYAGTDNGLSVIPINSLKPRKSFKFFVNPISVNKDTIWNITDTIKSHTGYRIYAALNAISLGVKGGVTFYYRVNERDSNFYATNDPNVNLTFSKVGTYTFEAYGIDINNIKSVRSILTIVVVPFWYQTQVFKWSCIIAALLFIYLFIRVLSYYVRKREQEKIAVQNRITKLELDVWKSNINPHFLYNSLNIIQSLFLNNKFEDANRYVGTFTSVLRNTIDNSEHLMNKIDEEIQYLHDYLELECMKRSGRLSFEIQADETSSVTSFYMPSLLLQPIVENSIKHGLKQGANCHILIQFELKGELIVATVQDNGPGLPEENKNYTNSKGLSLVQDKIRLVENITNQKIVFVMGNLYNVSNKPCGVISKFTLPLFSKQDFELG